MARKIISSALSAEDFARTRMAAMVGGAGLVADTRAGTLSGWRLSGTELGEDGRVWFTGELFEAESLADALGSGDSAWAGEAALTAVRALSLAVDGGVPVGDVGGSGILVGRGGMAAFLPPALASQCARNDRSRSAAGWGRFVYAGLAPDEQPLFTRAVVAYRALSGEFPFTAARDEERQADVYDGNFVPVSLMVGGLDPALSSAIDAGLSVRADLSDRSEERWRGDGARTARRRAALAPARAFDVESFARALDSVSSGGAVRSPSLGSFVRRNARRVAVRRFLRRNGRRIAALAAAAALAAWGVSSLLETRGNLATSAGLTAEETTRLMYSLVHASDVPDLSEIAVGGEMEGLVESAAGFLVASREREAHNIDDRTAPVEKWLFLNHSSHTRWWTFGLTNLRVGGVPASLHGEFPRRRDDPAPISTDGGRPLSAGDRAEVPAEYFFVYTDEAFVHVDRRRETAELLWDGGRWTVRRISGSTERSAVRRGDFLAELSSLLAENGGSVRAAAAALRAKYPWVPTDAELLSGAEELSAGGNAAAARFVAGE